ncbi:MAG: ABC transporter permease [Candidatus Hodarchaeota archaeon]
MLTIYKKQIQKTWLFWILPITLLVAMALLVVWIWPEYEPILIQMEEAFKDNPLLDAFFGESDLGSFEGFVTVEMFIMADILFMALIVLVGTMAIAREADSGTLDVILSYPVSRWKFLLEKLLAIITLSVTFPIFVWGGVAVGAAALSIKFHSEAFLLALLGKWIVYMVFTCITLLCSVIFMDTTKTLGSAGLILGGSWIFDRFGALIRNASEETADILQGVSLFHYLDGSNVMNTLMNRGDFPLDELVLVLAIGIGALLAALFLFQKRQFTYI